MNKKTTENLVTSELVTINLMPVGKEAVRQYFRDKVLGNTRVISSAFESAQEMDSYMAAVGNLPESKP